jgi:hypothetical protein
MFIQRPGNAAKRYYRYYACAKRVASGSCGQSYIPAARLERAVIGKLQALADHPQYIRPFLNREIQRRRAGRQDLERRAAALDREIDALDRRQREMVDWLAETLPGKAAARKLNEKIEAAEQEKKKLAEERATLRGRLAAGDLVGVSADTIAGHLAPFRRLLRPLQRGPAQGAGGSRGAGSHSGGTGPGARAIQPSHRATGALRPAARRRSRGRFKVPGRIATPTGFEPSRSIWSSLEP